MEGMIPLTASPVVLTVILGAIAAQPLGEVLRLVGGAAGVRVGFDVEVHAADEDGIELSATGPIGPGRISDVLAVLLERDRHLVLTWGQPPFLVMS